MSCIVDCYCWGYAGSQLFSCCAWPHAGVCASRGHLLWPSRWSWWPSFLSACTCSQDGSHHKNSKVCPSFPLLSYAFFCVPFIALVCLHLPPIPLKHTRALTCLHCLFLFLLFLVPSFQTASYLATAAAAAAAVTPRSRLRAFGGKFWCHTRCNAFIDCKHYCLFLGHKK